MTGVAARRTEGSGVWLAWSSRRGPGVKVERPE